MQAQGLFQHFLSVGLGGSGLDIPMRRMCRHGVELVQDRPETLALSGGAKACRVWACPVKRSCSRRRDRKGNERIAQHSNFGVRKLDFGQILDMLSNQPRVIEKKQ